ncbi:MAG: ribonuclease P protein component [Rikenellaceae bacterium]
MNVGHSLPSDQRLRSRAAIRRLFDEGKSGFIYPVRYLWVADRDECGEENHCEVLFTVPKKFHKRANKRNLLRRRIKESYRLQKQIIGGKSAVAHNIDLVMIYTTKEEHSYKTIDNAVRKILENIAKDL